jgi:hypothetical protein
VSESLGGLLQPKSSDGKRLSEDQKLCTSKNKFGHVFLFTPIGVVENAVMTHRFLQQKIKKYGAL